MPVSGAGVFHLALCLFLGHHRCTPILKLPQNSESKGKTSHQLWCYLCEAARGGTLGGRSVGTEGVPSIWGPGLRLRVTSGTSLSYSQ